VLKPKVANMKFNRIYLLLFLLNITNSLFSQQRPNIIYILADDLGYGDLSCYGQKKFSTPNIDELFRQGMLFTRHYAGCAVCAPSRSSLMSGQTTGYTGSTW
jgi:arylsulfatase A-like enzyme